jgi:hypothetical protein
MPPAENLSETASYRLAVQLFTETVVLAAIGGILSVPVASPSLRCCPQSLPAACSRN